MRKIIFIFTIILALIFACSCGGDTQDSDTDTSSQVAKKVTIRAEYIASEGGYIEGKATQAIEVLEGKSTGFSGVIAVASEGYYFVKWSDGSTEPRRADTLSQNSSFTAIFEKLIAVNYNAGEGGKIIGNASQQIKKDEATSEVTALALEGYRFIGWADGHTDAKRTDIASENEEYEALFEKIQYNTISYKCSEGGKIDGSATQQVENGKSTVQITAVPLIEGYYFVKWDDGLTTPTRTDVANEDKTITALFSNEVTISYQASEGGYIAGEASQALSYGSLGTTVMAIAKQGYVFVRWDDGNTLNVRQDKAKGNITYTAIFQVPYSVEFSCDQERGTISGELSQIVGEGKATSTVTAIPNEGYDFICWSDGSTNPEISVTAYEDMELYAYFSYESTGLPVVSITTETGKDVTSKTEYIGCTVTLYDTVENEHFIEQVAEIRGRGNSTWNLPKKPYKVKFESKQDFFDNGKAKTWVLLADYRDYSLVRNYLAFELGEEFSELGATPDCQSVEVYLNGEYRGIYLLCEQIEVNDHRVEVSEDEAAIDTGYLLEMDGWTDDVQVYVPDNLSSGRKYTVKAPDSDVITSEQKAFIEDYLKQCISAIQGDDYSKVNELIDVKSFAQAYIIFELFKNPDTNYSSLYFYKDAGGKLICGPLWDFDMAVGNVSHKGNGVFESTETLWTKEQCPWFKALLNHEEFVQLVGSELSEYAPVIRETLAKKYEYIYAHADAYKKNFEKWDILGKQTWSNPSYLVKIESWEEHIAYIQNYLEESLQHLEKVYCNEQN